MTDTPAYRGTPPSTKELAAQLGPRRALWDALVELVATFDSTWRWMHSEMTNSWSYRAYQPGDRFFVALSPSTDALELSLNMKAEEWDIIHTPDAAEQAFLEGLRDQAIATGKDPAWLHVKVTSQSQLPAIAKLLFARGKRLQAPRSKKRGKR